MELSLRKERENQEAKDVKVLDILKFKDAAIEDLQQKNVKQESEIGKISQAYQELLKHSKEAEEDNQHQKETVRLLSEQLEQVQRRLLESSDGANFEHLQNQLQDSVGANSHLQAKIYDLEASLQEKTSNEVYWQEAIDRFKNINDDKDEKIRALERDVESLRKENYSKDDKIDLLNDRIKELNQIN